MEIVKWQLVSCLCGHWKAALDKSCSCTCIVPVCWSQLEATTCRLHREIMTEIMIVISGSCERQNFEKLFVQMALITVFFKQLNQVNYVYKNVYFFSSFALYIYISILFLIRQMLFWKTPQCFCAFKSRCTKTLINSKCFQIQCFRALFGPFSAR